jgi:hypothetical protein
MLLAAIGTIQFGCNACGRPATTPVSAQIILEGVVGSDCNFAAMAATGQQHIDIWVRDRWGNGTNITHFGKHYQVNNVPNLTYDVEVPSRGPFEIEVEVFETDTQTCSRCLGFCTAPNMGVPMWRELVVFQNGGVSGVTYNIPVNKCATPGCCRCI